MFGELVGLEVPVLKLCLYRVRSIKKKKTIYEWVSVDLYISLYVNCSFYFRDRRKGDH